MKWKRKTQTAPDYIRHSKSQLLAAGRFTPQEKDFLRALLSDDEVYSVPEAMQLLNQYLNQEAK